VSTFARSADEQVAAIMRGDAVACSGPDSAQELLAAAERHGVSALLAERLDSRATAWPHSVQEVLGRQRALASALEALRQRELKAVLQVLADRGVGPLLLKGTALAYRLYADAAHRPRFDTDLLVRREELDTVDDVMRTRGYVRAHQVTGELVMHQVDYVRKDAQGIRHVYDFHWKLSNRQAVASILTFDELSQDSIAIEALGPSARGLCNVHALIHACVHRVAHHPGDERLIWLYDIHLLLGALSRQEMAAFEAIATARSVAALCLEGVTTAQRWFDTRLAEGSLRRLSAAAHVSDGEPSAGLLQIRGAGFDELLSDLRAVGWTGRARLVYEHAFPPATYISGMYMVSNRIWLPALYTHRIVRGVWRWVRGAVR